MKVNGDPRKGLLVGSALASLDEWHLVLRPPTTSSDGDLATMLGAAIARIVFSMAALLPLGFGWLLRRRAVPGWQRAELLADLLAARVAGPAAAHSLLNKLLIGLGVELAMQRHARGRRANLWQAARTQAQAVTPEELDRLLEYSRKSEASIDRHHPPTHVRLELVAAQPPADPQVRLAEPLSQEIQAELARATEELEGRVSRALRY
jgi:hypothetical protein